MLIRLVIKQAFRRRRPAATATGVSSTAPVLSPPRKYLQRWCFDIYRRRYSLFVGFNASGFQVDVVIGRLATIAQIRQSTVSLRPSSSSSVSCHRHFSPPLSGWHWYATVGFGVHHFDQRFRDHRVEAAQRACLRTNRCVFAPRPLITPAIQRRCNPRQQPLRALAAPEGEEAIRINTVFHARNIRVARTPPVAIRI